MFSVPKEAERQARQFMGEVFPRMVAEKSAEVRATAHKHVFPSKGGGHCAFCGEKA